MHVMTCRTAQRCLQIRADLDALNAAELMAHLAGCGDCRRLHDEIEDVDRLIHQHLDAMGRTPSVRGAVLTRIQASHADHAFRRSRFFRVRLFRVTTTLPLLIAALVVALLFPTNLTGVSVPPAAAVAFPVIRASIGFPFAFDPTLPNHMLAGADGQVYESFDAGTMWHRLGSLPPHLVIRALAIDRAYPNRYIVAVLRSIFVSDDRGRHWHVTAQSLLGAMNMFLVQDPRLPHTFYVGPSVLWKSVDGGNTWHRTGKGLIFAPYGIQAVAIGPGNTLVTGIWGGGVGLSRNGGITWTRDELGLSLGVLDVAVAPSGSRWAATSRGAYFQSSESARWTFRGPAHGFFTTTVVVAGRTVLAGGDGGVFRSVDGGKSWSLATDGLPMAPYVNSIQGDPFHPGRIYASLNSDGIFRSDDGGRTWTGKNAGIPLGRSDSGGRLVLFLRGGALWHTDTDGTDPGVLTLDDDVQSGLLTPDGVGASYVAGTSGRWEVREVAAGGSAARTVARLRSPVLPRMSWSPDSALLAVGGAGEVVVARRSGAPVRWRLWPGDSVVGWSSDSRSLVIWNSHSRRISTRAWKSGRTLGVTNTLIASAPVEAPDHVHTAWIQGTALRISAIDGGKITRAPLGAQCRIAGWTLQRARILLSCGRDLQIWSATGRHLATISLPQKPKGVLSGAPAARFLVFMRGGLWTVSPQGAVRLLVRGASPA